MPAIQPAMLAVDDFSLLPPPLLAAWHYQHADAELAEESLAVSPLRTPHTRHCTPSDLSLTPTELAHSTRC